MPHFDYIATNREGQKIIGTIEAASQNNAVEQLTKRDLFPTLVTATDSPHDAGQTNHTQPEGRWRRRQRQSATIIPVSIAMFCFVLYGARTLDAPWTFTLLALCVPTVWLLFGLGSYFYYGRLSKRALDDDAD
jgi:hypothetical protein